MDKQRAEQLFEKLRNDTLTPQERAELESWYTRHAGMQEPLRDAEIFRNRLAEMDSAFPFRQPARVKRLWPRIAAAASIILAISAGGYFLLKTKQQPQQIAQNQTHDVAPGHNQATLTLANGKKIILTRGLSGLLALQGKTAINASGNNIIYTPSKKQDQVSYNTLSTARGEQSPYPLVLADGTKVWLNAESSITFPTAFNGKQRIVKVTGEAYFEVKHNAAHPFKVITEKQTIEDIGTVFDVKAYGDEAAATTLIEGSVKVNSILLKPGEQLINDKVQTVNTSRYTAWKNSDFDFEGDNIQTVMRELARWYTIDVGYEGSANKIAFYAKISRSQNISVVLSALQRTQGVKFKIDGRRVTIIQ